MLFNQPDHLHFGHVLDKQPNQNQIRALPPFFHGDDDMVYRMGGLFLRHLLEQVPLTHRFKYISIDTRTHMLMPKMYPCIPGWHCDDFYCHGGTQPGCLWRCRRFRSRPGRAAHATACRATRFPIYSTGPAARAWNPMQRSTFRWI
jgi:hypothetical protein